MKSIFFTKVWKFLNVVFLFSLVGNVGTLFLAEGGVISLVAKSFEHSGTIECLDTFR